jgi:hypothetical protein
MKLQVENFHPNFNSNWPPTFSWMLFQVIREWKKRRAGTARD